MNIFLDSNIVYDFIFRRIPFYDDARTVMLLSEDEDTHLFMSALTVITGVYIAKKQGLSLKEVKATFLRMSKVVGFIGMNHEDVISALESTWKDFEDFTQYECAASCQADYIVTRNKKDFTGSTIMVCSPAELLDRIHIS